MMYVALRIFCHIRMNNFLKTTVNVYQNLLPPSPPLHLQIPVDSIRNSRFSLDFNLC